MQLPIEKVWIVAQPIPNEKKKALNGYSEVLQQILYNRGINSIESAKSFLDNETDFHDPFLFLNMELAVNKILEAIKGNEKIAIFGDYDVDGISATALLSQVLLILGADIEPYIPERSKEGYGVNTYAIETLHQKNVKLIVTVDCGIRSINELEYAKNLGISVIVTDHHTTGDQIPEVDAVICQHLENDLYPDKNLSGVGLAFKLSQALLTKNPIEGVDINDWLDLAALGTVADVVPLIGENRKIVKAGIKKIRLGKRIGLRSLVNCSGIHLGNLVAADISFAIAPRLNAAGRLASPKLALELLMTSDPYRAGVISQELDDLNRQRQKLTQELQKKADEMIDPTEMILFAQNEDFEAGLVGLVASKLTEFYYRPTVIGHVEENTTRASCRSIPEFHITQALDQCGDLLIQHGGHAMAAGFTITNENLPELINRLQKIARDSLDPEEIKPSIQVDIDIPLKKIPKEILKELDRLEPIGAENPGVVFISRNVQVVHYRTVGRDKSHLKLSLKDGSIIYDAIAFNQGHWEKVMPNAIDVLYSIERNFFNGNIFTQLNIRDIKATNLLN